MLCTSNGHQTYLVLVMLPFAEIFGVEVQFENPLFAFVRGPGVVVGFHPADEKYPGGIGGTSARRHIGRSRTSMRR